MRDKILSEISRLTGERGGRPPSRAAFEKATGIGLGAWLGVYWASWNEAVQASGCKPNSWKRPRRDDELLEALAHALRRLNRIPTQAELKLYARAYPGFPALNTLVRHFNSTGAMFGCLYRWVEERPGFSDVGSLLKAGRRPKVPNRDLAREGCVYLIQSALGYKILPIEATGMLPACSGMNEAIVEHAILTDDPQGIARYWQERFDGRKSSEEWLALSESDLVAFRRRKFQ